ncbi:hypothetical protein BZA77DRAFT_339056 [Pyronema omphalodes]|nr:hypothetical protein BZA77DRAFT_339056 [Pyronema omphalodes]
MRSLALLSLLTAVAAVAAADTPDTTDTADCRAFPGTTSWPSPSAWSSLNTTLSGRLISTAPLASPCHDPHYNATLCASIQSQWRNPSFHDSSSSSIMAPVWSARSCDPFTPREQPCELGNYIHYAINVTSAADIAVGLKWAKEHNVRVVVRNTGHDYLGKSTGAAALGIWTHWLKKVEYHEDWRGEGYRGRAFTFGAGVQGFEAYREADKRGLVVVGGECDTVGIAGGYTQGGGHSALNSRYGLAADQVLEWEVVTADGEVRRVRKGDELYWALSGGGGGTFGVVTEMTVKAFPDEVTTIAKVTWTNDGTEEQEEAFWKAVGFFHQQTLGYTDAGITSVNVAMKGLFMLTPFFAMGFSKEETYAMLMPLLNKLSELKVPHTVNVTEYSGYQAAFSAGFGNIEVGIAQYGGRLIPRKTVLYESEKLEKTYRDIVDSGSLIFEVVTHPTLELAGFPDNSVLPAWRENQLNLVTTIPWNDTAPWSQVLADQKTVTEKWGEALRRLTPGSGTYMNEADPFEPDFKEAFFGQNYDRLLRIKDKYDPDQIFWGRTAVGSDRWAERENGQLCRVVEN